MNPPAFHHTTAPFPNESLKELIEQQCARSPHRTAVTFRDQSLSFQELNGKANQLARLLRQKGLKADQPVGIMVERSLEMIIGLWAIIKAGGAYLPLSPALPEKRIQHMLSDSGAAILLCQSASAGKLDFPGTIVPLENEELYSGEDSNLPTLHGPGDAAYLIYTSGSTGLPKGVVIEHRSIVNRLHWMQKAYPIGESDTLLQKTPFSFDVSVWELFWWAIAGARLHILPPKLEGNPIALIQEIEAQTVTVLHFVPTMLNVFLEYLHQSGEAHKLSSLRLVFASGEALDVAHVQKFYHLLGHDGPRLVNLYGPTETTVDVTSFDCSPGAAYEKIPIGKPIDNIRLYIVDEQLQPLPAGETGELLVCGVGLARGYLNQPKLTGEAFVQPPFPGEVRAYRTGDLARLNAEGEIEFLGRKDFQIKIRGLRIELGEIESLLKQHPAIKNCVVLAREYSENIILLLAYLVPKAPIETAALKAYLKEYLPAYMIPHQYVSVDKIPLTPNGKADRKALQGRTGM